MKKVVITQSNYIPWKGYFDGFNICDEIILYDDVQYTKRDWRNRNMIKTANGPQWLSIPVEVKGKYFQRIMDTKISDKTWARQHWGAIKHNYSKATFFKEVSPVFEELYLGDLPDLLSEVNLLFIQAINNYLGIKAPIRFSGEFSLPEGKTERLVELCVQLGATDYYSGPSARNYIDENLFAEKNVKVHYFDYSGYPPYRQQYGDFVHELSIIDLLMNEGTGSKSFMKSFQP